MVGDSRFQRLTTPLRVPNAKGTSLTAVIRGRHINRSNHPFAADRIGVLRHAQQFLGLHTTRDTERPIRGETFGNLTTWASTRRPAEVTKPYEERVDVRNIETI